MDNNIIVDSIKKLCKDKNITVSQLEKEIGLSQGLVSKWMNTTPSLDKIVDIADYFRVTLDEVVGYKQDDIFLNMLHDLTNSKKIRWSIIKKDYVKVAHIKKAFPFEAYDEEKYTEKSYFTQYKGGYIIIYAFYENGKLINPDELSLYIQPSEAQLEYAWQDYSTYDLKPLWLDILSNMDKVPVEVKAEEFKNNFVLNNSKLNSKNTISKKSNLSDIRDLMSSPEVLKLMELYNQPAFREMQETLNNPEVQAAIQIANKVQGYFDQ